MINPTRAILGALVLALNLLASSPVHALRDAPLPSSAAPARTMPGPALWALLAELAAECHAAGQAVSNCIAPHDKTLQ